MLPNLLQLRPAEPRSSATKPPPQSQLPISHTSCLAESTQSPSPDPRCPYPEAILYPFLPKWRAKTQSTACALLLMPLRDKGGYSRCQVRQYPLLRRTFFHMIRDSPNKRELRAPSQLSCQLCQMVTERTIFSRFVEGLHHRSS
jgi:hypothetical protein